MLNIYIADDEINIRHLIKSVLEKEIDGLHVTTFETGDQLLLQFMKKESDLVILDVMMPGNDGFYIAKSIRELSERVPIILLTARDNDEDFILGFQTGIDDYLTKPFSPIRLALQVKALLKKRLHPLVKQDSNQLIYKHLILTPSSRLLEFKGKNTRLTRNESDILRILMLSKGNSTSRNDLLDIVWGIENEEVETRVIDDTMKRLRKKLREVESHVIIETIWGFGFKLSEKD